TPPLHDALPILRDGAAAVPGSGAAGASFSPASGQRVGRRVGAAEAVHDLARRRPAVLRARDLLGAETPRLGVVHLALELAGIVAERRRLALRGRDLAFQLRDAPAAVVGEHGYPRQPHGGGDPEPARDAARARSRAPRFQRPGEEAAAAVTRLHGAPPWRCRSRPSVPRPSNLLPFLLLPLP